MTPDTFFSSTLTGAEKKKTGSSRFIADFSRGCVDTNFTDWHELFRSQNLGVRKWESMVSIIDRHAGDERAATIPTGLRPTARGCAPCATLGNRSQFSPYPNGVASFLISCQVPSFRFQGRPTSTAYAPANHSVRHVFHRWATRAACWRHAPPAIRRAIADIPLRGRRGRHLVGIL